MSTPNVTTTEIKQPVIVLGKHFMGDYMLSQQYIMEVQDTLRKEGIDFIPFKVLGAFYDNPGQTPTAELRSFHAVFPQDSTQVDASSLERFELKGRFLQTVVTGDPVNSIMNGYNALFNYIHQNGIQLKSPAGFQISTFENGVITTEILMEI